MSGRTLTLLQELCLPADIPTRTVADNFEALWQEEESVPVSQFKSMHLRTQAPALEARIMFERSIMLHAVEWRVL